MGQIRYMAFDLNAGEIRERVVLQFEAFSRTMDTSARIFNLFKLAHRLFRHKHKLPDHFIDGRYVGWFNSREEFEPRFNGRPS